MPARDVESINRAAWASAHLAEGYAAADGWSDVGERAALLAVADEMRGRAVLDIGVGGGRTTALLRLLTDRYVGIDYSAAMVDAARRRFPDERLNVGDVRDLSAFPDASFALALFSFNGIDYMGHDDRQAALVEVRRILMPAGAFVFSSHNYHGPARTDRPWRLRAAAPLPRPRAAYHVAKRAWELPASLGNYRRGRARSADAGTWAVAPSEDERFSLLVHYTTAAAQCRALTDAGFDAVHVREPMSGELVAPGAEVASAPWLVYSARVPNTA